MAKNNQTQTSDPTVLIPNPAALFVPSRICFRSLKGKKPVESTVGPAGKATTLPSHSSVARQCEAPEADETQKEQA